MNKGVMRKDAMRTPSVSMVRLRNDDSDPYQSLANAIVCVAADDYRTALRDDDTLLLSNLRWFFKSAWCSMLTNIDTELLMESLEKEYRSGIAAANA